HVRCGSFYMWTRWRVVAMLPRVPFPWAGLFGWVMASAGFGLLLDGAGEEIDEPEGCVVPEAEIQDDVTFCGFGLAAGEHRFFVRGDCRFDAVGVQGDRGGEFGAVEHRQVGALARGDHQVGGITEEGHSRHVVPA